ncbi:MAG: DUF2283 domain-containing protein [Candidatus Omnitrophica bacterium]|nr:DUF2283 domain-containing protein [Candidatus Omnitrophota bacterium]
MRVEYDPKHDLMNIEFLAGVAIAESVETDGIVFDYDKDRRIVSLEILDVSKRITRSPLEKIDFAVTME